MNPKRVFKERHSQLLFQLVKKIVREVKTNKMVLNQIVKFFCFVILLESTMTSRIDLKKPDFTGIKKPFQNFDTFPCDFEDQGLSFPDQESCKEYWLCDQGLFELRMCPVGQLFDPDLLSCEPENTVNCLIPWPPEGQEPEDERCPPGRKIKLINLSQRVSIKMRVNS